MKYASLALVLGWGWGLGLPGCGARDGPSTNTSFSCDVNTGASHYCNEQICSGGAGGSAALCTQSGGTPGTAVHEGTEDRVLSIITKEA